jgi:hypothetical protein
VEEDILKVVVRYRVQEEERRGRWEGSVIDRMNCGVRRNGNKIIIIIIIMFLGSISEDQQTTWPCDSHWTIIWTFPICGATAHCSECSTDSNKMQYTTQIS